MSPIQVSVLMPVLDPDPVYFPLAVESILKQSLKELELIIVEDPSPHSAAALLASMPDPRIRHIANPERTSLREQRNRALQEARGEFVAMQDADDISAPDRLARQAAYLEAHPEIGVLGSQLIIIDTEGKQRGQRIYPTGHEKILKAMRRFNPIAQPAVMARREALLVVGGYQMDGPAEDYDLWCRLARVGVGFANLPEPLVRYRIHPQASKGTQLRATLRNTLAVKRKHWSREMGLVDRTRCLAERLLLALPPRLVLSLFYATQYRRTGGS